MKPSTLETLGVLGVILSMTVGMFNILFVYYGLIPAWFLFLSVPTAVIVCIVILYSLPQITAPAPVINPDAKSSDIWPPHCTD